jgi:hypothetical protein
MHNNKKTIYQIRHKRIKHTYIRPLDRDSTPDIPNTKQENKTVQTTSMLLAVSLPSAHGLLSNLEATNNSTARTKY